MLNSRVTLLCRFGPARAEAWQATPLEGVYFEGEAGAAAAVGAANEKARGILILPYASARKYVCPSAWQALPAEDRAGHFTLQPGDAICTGTATPAEGESPAAFLERTPHWVITRVIDYPHGSMAHFEVLCGTKEAIV